MAGGDLDVKFGLSVNENLTDQILVSVIATDFDEDFDSTALPDYPSDLIEKNNAKDIDEEKVKKITREDDEENYIPDFLKDLK